MTQNSPPPSEREAAELEKIRAETAKLRADTEKALADGERSRHEADTFEASQRETRKWELLRTLVSASSIVIAVVSLSVSWCSDSRQRRDAAEQRRDEAFAQQAGAFGEAERTPARVAAISGLAAFWGEPRFHPQLVTLLVQGARGERDPIVLDAIQQLLVDNADSLSLHTLAVVNREIQAQIALRTGLRRRELPLYAGSNVDLDEQSNDEYCPWFAGTQSQPIRSRVLSDSARAAQRAVRSTNPHGVAAYCDLVWNYETMTRSMNQMKVVRGVDLSGVVLSRVFFRPTPGRPANPEDAAFEPLVHTVRKADPADSLVFDRVDFSRANLSGLTFRGATFQNARLDSMIAFGTRFHGSRFEGTDTSTVRRFLTFPPSMRRYWYGVAAETAAGRDTFLIHEVDVSGKRVVRPVAAPPDNARPAPSP